MRPVRSALSALDAWVESYKTPARVPIASLPAAAPAGLESYTAPAPRVPPLNLASLPAPTRQAPLQHRVQGGAAPAIGFGAGACCEDTTAAVPHHDQSRQAAECRQGGAAGEAQGNIHPTPGLRGAGLLGALGCAALSSMRVFAGRRGQRGSSEREDGEMLREQSCPHDINPPRLPSPIEENFFKSPEA